MSTKSRKVYDAVATIGEYTDQQTKEKKKVRKNVGAVFESPEGNLSLKLELVPVGPGWSGFISLYPVDAGEGERRLQRSAQSVPGPRTGHQNGAPPPVPVRDTGEDDDIPF